VIKRVFELAYRWTPSTLAKDETVLTSISGTGLGLWQAKTLLEAQGGKIQFINDPVSRVVLAVNLPAQQNTAS